MGESEYARIEHEPGNLVLSDRQRDWLATYTGDAAIELYDQEDDGELVFVVWHRTPVDHDAHEWIADEDVTRIPWEGALDQPVVRLEDVDQELDDLPETGERDG